MQLRSGAVDPVSVRSRVESLLSGLSLFPAGLSSDSILVVRKIGEAGSASPHLDLEHPIRQSEWERHVVTRIDQMVQRAARPLFESVHLDAEAVLFADRAELIACLVMDWLEGNHQGRWWWHNFLRNKEISRTVVSAWLESPEYVPSVLHHLSRRGKSIPFLRSLSDSAIRASLRSITETFGLHAFAAVVDRSAVEGGKNQNFWGDEPQTETTVSSAPGRPLELLPGLSLRAPWQDWAPEANGNSLDVERQTLLGVGLMLCRAPEVVRGDAFAREFMDWKKAPHTSRSQIADLKVLNQNGDSANQISPRSRVTDSGSTDVNRPRHKADSGAVRRENTENDERGQKESSMLEPFETSSTDSSGYLSKPPSNSQSQRANAIGDELKRIAEETSADHRIHLHDEDDTRTVEDANSIDGRGKIRPDQAEMVGLLGEEVETKYGGIFYLINLGLALGLYSDFTSPNRSGIGLSIWDFLALVGRDLAGANISKDPIWRLLAELAGRRIDDPPGRGFRPSSSWRVPLHWLDAFPEHVTCRWSAEKGRLRVRHPAKFLLIDVPMKKGSAVHQLESELVPYGFSRRIQVQRAPIGKMLERSSQVSQWMVWFAPYARARLLRGLGMTRQRGLGKLVCMHQARIIVTPTRIDVEFDLTKLPVQVRLGGLDRDPGWVPAAGRFVSFQYK